MIRQLYKIVLFLGTPLTFLSTLWLKLVSKSPGKIEDNIFMTLGILPVADQYYQPLINPKKHLSSSLRENRKLKGIDFNDEEQLSLLSAFHYNDELLKFPLDNTQNLEFYYNNGSYESGDAEFLYNFVRHFKPKNIIEIGSGNSTLMAKNAILKNKNEDHNYQCKHVCIEPYEQPWLEKVDVELVRKKVEDIDLSFFQNLEANDVLFIDSSHIIRPQGDVLYEFFEIIPTLKPGVIIHVHDIFSPKDYLDEWIFDKHLMWNEQYLLEAFLSYNSDFKIIGALNYLSHKYPNKFSAKAPVFAQQKNREPGAFWFARK